MTTGNKKTKLILYILGGLVVLGLLLAYLIRRDYEPAYLAVIMFLAAAGVALHISRALRWSGGTLSYLVHLTGAQAPAPGRRACFDHLRVMALCGVIITHAVQIDLESYSGVSAKVAGALWVVTMAANAAYVMLSGALLYRWKEEKLSTFYLRRFSEVVIPLIVYYMWYLAVNYHLGRGWNWVSIKSVPEWLLTNRMMEAPHLWLIYVILSIYLTVPFFRFALKNFPYRNLTAILTVLFLVTVLTPCINAFLVYDVLAVQVPFTGWLLISLYGYWVSLQESRRYDGIVILLGAAALAAICIIACITQSQEVLGTWCLNDAFLPAMFCTGLFAFVFRFSGQGSNGADIHSQTSSEPGLHSQRVSVSGDPDSVQASENTENTAKNRISIFSRTNPVLRILCRYSYGILLIHWYTIHFIVIDRFHVHASAWGGAGVILSLVLTLLFSWIICFIIDNLIVFPLKWVTGGRVYCHLRGETRG